MDRKGIAKAEPALMMGLLTMFCLHGRPQTGNQGQASPLTTVSIAVGAINWRIR